MAKRRYWLLKTEPEEFSWREQVERGEKGEVWSGVRNAGARNNLQAMKKGDRAFFYHTGGERRIVGIVEVIREHYPDPTAGKDEPWVAVDVKAVAPLPKPVTLAEVKSDPGLQGMALVKYPRLSVQPVTEQEWNIVCRRGGLK